LILPPVAYDLVMPTSRRRQTASNLSDQSSIIAIALAATCFLIAPRELLAWGRDGHEIVARIAEARLTSKAAAGVKELLGGEGSIVAVANWADQIRKERDETGPWHYVDIPYEMSSYDAERDGKNGNNIIDKLQELANVLNDRQAPREKRVEALKFVVHFMGDLHQPLHCAERNGDKGGNFRLVMFPGEQKAVNLHRIWDSTILNRAMERDKLSAADYAEKLNKAVTKEQEREWLANGDVARWALESHRLAVEIVYGGIPADGPPPMIDEKYLRTAEPTIDVQLQRAGVRLAALLNRVFHP